MRTLSMGFFSVPAASVPATVESATVQAGALKIVVAQPVVAQSVVVEAQLVVSDEQDGHGPEGSCRQRMEKCGVLYGMACVFFGGTGIAASNISFCGSVALVSAGAPLVVAAIASRYMRTGCCSLPCDDNPELTDTAYRIM